MFEDVDKQVDFVALEHEVLELWEKTEAFETLREINRGKPAWSFLDGPITANNPMGVHHAWGRTYKDAFQRYWAMNRRELRYQNGFDCQGLWVEVEVERQLGFKSKREIEAMGLETFTEACKERVRKYAGIQTEQSKRLGYWMDWDDSYFTMSEVNNYTIWGFLKECHERGYLYKGTDVMPWSGRAGSAYSDMEIKEGRKLTTHTSVFVRFPLRGRENEYLLVWTTTPWTLTSNAGAAVNGELDYVKVRAKRDGALYYLAAENFEFQRLEKNFKEGFDSFGKWPDGVGKLKTIAQIFKEQGGYEVEGTVKGAEMVGWTYDGPFDELEAQQAEGGWAERRDMIPEEQRSWPSGAAGHKVIDPGKDSKGSAYVVAGEGTGIVHSAPGCGDVDHIWGKQHGLVAIAPLDEDGAFIEGFGKFTGMKPTDPETVAALLDDLKGKGLLVAQETYPHLYPHCWRTGDELVYRLVDEWFISMDWREEIQETVKLSRWHPAEMRGEERELDWLRTMKDWMISKKRYWGLALPIWECKACGNVEVMGSREELQERAVEGWEVFDGNTPHRPYVDAVKIDCAKCGARVSRIPDVGNPWLDAGIVAYSTTKFGSDRAYWERWVPADLILECFPGQFRNWFYALLAMSTMMDLKRREESGGERKPPFKNLLGHALVKDEHGRAMHKSDGTAIWFEEAAEQVGVDTMRWMYCAQPPTVDLKFGLRHPEEEVTVALPGGEMTHTVDGVRFCKVTSTPADEKRRKVLLTLWHSYAFFCEYARLDGFRPGVDVVAVAERPDIDRWVLSELQVLVGEVRGAFERFELNKACEQLERYVDVLSNWYIRRNRPRFWRSEGGRGDADKRAAYQTLYDALLTVTKLIAPVVPFLAETMYQNLGRAFDAGAPASVHHVEYPVVDEGLIDGELSASMNATIRLVGLGRAVRSQEKIGVRQPLRTMTVMPGDDAEAAAARRFAEQIKEELNVKELEVRQDAGLVSYELKANFKTLGPKFGKEVKAVVAALGKLDASAAAPKVQAGEALEVEVGGRTVQVEASDVKLFVQQPEGTASVQDGGTVVVLDTVITEELAREGLARDVVRKLQDLRKTSGFAVEDRIQVRLATEDAALREAIEAHREWLSRQLLADTLEFAEVEGVEVVVRAQPKSVLRASLVKG